MTPKDPLVALDEAVRSKGTATAFAKSVGLSPGYVGDVMSGRKPASEKLLRALGLSRVVVKL